MKSDSSSHRRSLLKGFCWEIISTVITFGVAWLMFGHAAECVLFAMVCFAVKFILFYLHERIWHQVSYGKRSVCDQEEEEKTEWPSAYP